MQPPNLLEIRNLAIQFASEQGVVHAVDGISFHLQKEETLGIVGESGSGKSITALAVMGLLPEAAEVASGAIFFQNKKGEELDLAVAKQQQLQQLRGNELAMVFQEPMTSLNPVFCCGDQVVEAILQHQNLDKKAAKAQAMEWFGKVKLNDPVRIFNSFPHQLSGGQRQRVMIAMALSNNPSILIADEPTSALDVTVQRSILNLIRELKTEWDGSVIFISHDLAVIAEVADRVLVMRQGRVVEEGPVEEIFHRPKHAYTKQLLLDFKGANKLATVVKSEQLPVLKIKNLQTWYPGKRNFFGKIQNYVKAVDGVSFDIYKGETLGLVGESGSGKTTLGRTLLHLQSPSGGEVVYNGQSLTEVPDNQWKNIRRDLQIIFQDPYSSLNPRQMVGPAIMEPMTVHGIGSDKKERQKLAFELLEKVGLEEAHFWRFPKEFSGGQRQRICIARALAVQPKFIVCDECVSALDVTVQSNILRLLKDLQEENNLTYLFISHDISIVRQICDRIAVMKAGRLVELDIAEKVCGEPQNDYTKELMGAVPGWNA